MKFNWIELWESITALLYNTFIIVTNKIIEFIGEFITLVVGMLPDHRFEYTLQSNMMSQVVSTLNWVFPVNFFVAYLLFLAVSVTVYFTVGIFMRWAKII